MNLALWVFEKFHQISTPPSPPYHVLLFRESNFVWSNSCQNTGALWVKRPMTRLMKVPCCILPAWPSNKYHHDVPGHLCGAVRALGSTLGRGFGLARCAMPVQFYLPWLIMLIPGCIACVASWIFMMFWVTNQLYHRLDVFASCHGAACVCVVYEIIEVKSRGSCHVKFQGHGMVILPGLRPAAVDAARNKQLDCNDCFIAIHHQRFWDIKIYSPVSFKIVAQSGLERTVEADTQARHPRLSQTGRLANSKDGVESESIRILCYLVHLDMKRDETTYKKEIGYN